MLSFLRRKAAVSETSFKGRVQQFWDWYSQVAPRFSQVIERGDCSSLATEVSAKVDELMPGFAWVFGPGTNGSAYSFSLSGEGNVHRQLLALYWLERAPAVPGWSFHASRQPCSVKGQRMEIEGRAFDPAAFWLAPRVNAENEKVDVTVWHPMFENMPEPERWTVMFLFLDEVLGEYGTGQWIGEIKINGQRFTEAMPLEEVPEYLQRVQAEHGWKKLPPGQNAVLYRCDEPHARFLRGDIVVGSTRHPRLINEYLRAEGQLEDPLQGTGADYIFVAFESRCLATGGEAAARGAIEDALDQALKAEASGRLLGGACGTVNAYIDLLIFDGLASLEIVRRTALDQRLPEGATINFFAREKRGHRLLL